MYIEFPKDIPMYHKPEFNPSIKYKRSGTYTNEVEAERTRSALQFEGYSAYYIKMKEQGQQVWVVYSHK